VLDKKLDIEVSEKEQMRDRLKLISATKTVTLGKNLISIANGDIRDLMAL
jgi:hypothetical protein